MYNATQYLYIQNTNLKEPYAITINTRAIAKKAVVGAVANKAESMLQRKKKKKVVKKKTTTKKKKKK